MSSARNSRRRRRNRGRFSLLFKVLAIAAVLGALTLGATVFFQLEQVVVSGNSRYTAQEIQEASGLRTGDNLFRMNKNKVASDIREKLPYVEELSIVRHLPSTILITVKEWDAVARIEPTAQAGSAADSSSAGESGEEAPSPADQAWLISVGGKLLEPADGNDAAIQVLGLSALSPRAGMALAVPQEQQGKLDALLDLLQSLEARGSTKLVSQIDLTSSGHILMRYDGRFWVKLPMGGDFDYCLRALEAVVPDWKDYDSGTFDLTRKDYPVTFSPD